MKTKICIAEVFSIDCQATKICIAEVFSENLSGRTKLDSSYSAEEFLQNILLPAIHYNVFVELDFNGTNGYSSAFLEETFTNLIKKTNMSFSDFKRRVKIITNDKFLVYEIDEYVKSVKQIEQKILVTIEHKMDVNVTLTNGKTTSASVITDYKVDIINLDHGKLNNLIANTFNYGYFKMPYEQEGEETARLMRHINKNDLSTFTTSVRYGDDKINKMTLTVKII